MASTVRRLVLLAAALMVVASCGSEVAADGPLPDVSPEQATGEADADAAAFEACPAEGEATCALSLRQLRSRRLDDAALSEGGGGGAVEAEFEQKSAEEGALVGGRAEGEESVADAYHPPPAVYHANSAPESQLRWAHDRKFCMSADGNAFANGHKMQLWTCAGGMGQYFMYDSTQETTLLRSAAAPAFCVVIDGDQQVNGAKVQLWQCNPQDKAQRWKLDSDGFQNVLLRNAAYPGKCLVVNLNSGYDGNKLQIWDCQNNHHFKRWTLTHQ